MPWPATPNATWGPSPWARPATGSPSSCKTSGRPGKKSNPAWPPRSEEHTSELQSLMRISYAVFCLKKKKDIRKTKDTDNLIRSLIILHTYQLSDHLYSY